MSSPVLQFCGSDAQSNHGNDDDDETEVFFGAVTNRERHKASKYKNRRTVAFHPDFRKDHALMRYTMDHLQLLALAAENRSKVPGGSEGSDSCGSQSPLGSNSTGSSPVADGDEDDMPLEKWMSALSFSPEGGKGGVSLGCRYLDSPLSGAAEVITDREVTQIRRPGDKTSPFIWGNSAEKSAQLPGTVMRGQPYNHQRVDATFPSINARNTTTIFQQKDTSTFSKAIDTPKDFITSSLTNMADSSPLVNIASSSSSVASPQTILGNLASLCDGKVTYTDIFSQNLNSPSDSCITNYVSSMPQEVPNVLTPGGPQQELNKSDTDLWYNIDNGSHDDSDVSILTLGSVVDESLLDSSRRTYQYDTETDSDTSLCHQVPEVDSSIVCHHVPDADSSIMPEMMIDSPIVRRDRCGLMFTEKQFSPTLTVRVSPPTDPPPTSLQRKNINKLVLDLSKTHSYFSTVESLPPESPECLSDVKFSLSCDPPQSPSPKKSRVKRLSPSRSPKAESTKKNGSVFDRLYGLRKTTQSDKSSTKMSSTRKLDGGRGRSQSAGKAQGRVDNRTVKSPRLTSTPSMTSGAKRGLKFIGSKTSPDTKSHSSAHSIKTTGTLNRSAICQATKVTPTKHRKPVGLPSSSHKSPMGPPVFKKGTPRNLPGAGPGRHDVKKARNEPPPKLDLDDSLSDIVDDAASLDASILLQEKKVELERLHLTKIKLQKRVAAKKKSNDVLPTTPSPSRSPLIPTTVHNLPKVRYNNRQSLSLSEPELDAITLVHTLCNSQQVAKLVTKQRAAIVAKNTMHIPKPATKVQWRENLVSEEPIETETNCEPPMGKRRSILTIRQPGHHFPFNDQPLSPIVVTKGTRKFTGFCKDPNGVHIV